MNTHERDKKNCFWVLLIFICAKICLTLFGVTLTQIIYKQFHVPFISAVVIGALSTLSLALLITFHKYSRCIFMLMIFQYLKKRGRIFIIGYAFFLAFSHPGKNLLHNYDELTASLSCILVCFLLFLKIT